MTLWRSQWEALLRVKRPQAPETQGEARRPEAQQARLWLELSAGLDCSRPAGTAESGTSALLRALCGEAA